MYVIIACARCNNLLLGNTKYKTRACPHCGHKMVLRERRVFARTESTREAVEMIQELKKRDFRNQ